jgi:Flp pilus assembly pilin Flp
MKLFHSLLNDEAGFVVSAELVLIATILVIGLVVGLAEVSTNINQELEDVGSAVGSVNQTFHYSGLKGHKGWVVGSGFRDVNDFCDSQYDLNCDQENIPGEANK